MAKTVHIQSVVKHIVNGSFSDNLCRVCLLPLGDRYEDVFTRVIKEGMEYCIADVLDAICQIKLTRSDQYNVCLNCFFEASAAYKFYLLSKRSEEILTYYINHLYEYVQAIEIPQEFSSDSVCINMQSYEPQTEVFNYDLSGLCVENHVDQLQKNLPTNDGAPSFKLENIDVEKTTNSGTRKEVDPTDALGKEDEEIVIVMAENGEPSFYKTNDDGTLVALESEDVKSHCVEMLQTGYEAPRTSDVPLKDVNGKRRRRRTKMDYKKCSQCPIKYRFVAKLKEHMKTDHNIDIFVCKVCKAIIENEAEFNNHTKTHMNFHRCSICNAVFKKRETIITHLKSHEAMKELSKAKSARICEICGWILKDEASLHEHHQEKHVKKYTCYYCGRMYKGEVSFDMHIKKHEAHMNMKQKRSVTVTKEASKEATKEASKETTKEKRDKRRRECGTCHRSFVDERSLMWHQRLHNDERPYVCEVCGRGFVSVNRRNQHALCAHTAPARRCPLCPALFHLRSMVNSHIKKVHLQRHKRRNRSHRRPHVFWRTETVPFQELSVAVQSDILDLTTEQGIFLQGEQFPYELQISDNPYSTVQ